MTTQFGSLGVGSEAAELASMPHPTLLVINVSVCARAGMSLAARAGRLLHQLSCHRRRPAFVRVWSSQQVLQTHAAAAMERQEDTPSVLKSEADMYDGVIIDPGHLPTDPVVFAAQLQHSLHTWAADGKRGIWLRVPLHSVQLVEPAVKLGQFVPHHAERDYIMLVRWLPQTPCTLPPNASHQVGVGAFVVNSRQEVLVVQERHGPLRGRGVWKMPTGLVHENEDLNEGAEREVFEETGIRARFKSILAIRQAHGFGLQSKSDLFIVVGLQPEPGQEDITLAPQESEIEAVKWMPLNEYMAQPFMQGVDLYDKLRERCGAYAQGQYLGWQGAKLEAGFLRKRQDLLLWGPDDCGFQNSSRSHL